MKIVVFGSNGFIGSAVAEELRNTGHEVLDGENPGTGTRVDLLEQEQVANYFSSTVPAAVINCAGIIDPEDDFSKNVKFTTNILGAIKDSGVGIDKVVIIGSAGEYGEVDSLPVPETAPLRATSPYALSKIEEEKAALEFANEDGVKVIVARVFNPIGIGMKPRFLISGLLRQIKSIKDGEGDKIELSSLGSPRDYIAVNDVAVALRLIVEGSPEENVYNIGSGVSTTNGELLNLLLENAGVTIKPEIVETSTIVEPRIASQADITRMKAEFSWKPEFTLEQTVKGIIDATR